MSERQRVTVSIKTKIEIVEKFKSGVERKDLVRIYNIAPSTLSKILKNSDVLQQQKHSGKNLSRKRTKKSKYEQINVAMSKWFSQMMAKEALVTGPIILKKAQQFAIKFGITDFTPNMGWMQRWKRDENISCKKLPGESQPANHSGAISFKENLFQSVLEEDTADNICIADETGIFYKTMPSATYAPSNKPVKDDENRSCSKDEEDEDSNDNQFTCDSQLNTNTNELSSQAQEYQQQQHRKQTQESQRLQRGEQQEHIPKTGSEELLNKSETTDIRTLLRQLLNAQTENNEIQKARLNLERERFEFEKNIAKRFLLPLPSVLLACKQKQQHQNNFQTRKSVVAVDDKETTKEKSFVKKVNHLLNNTQTVPTNSVENLLIPITNRTTSNSGSTLSTPENFTSNSSTEKTQIEQSKTTSVPLDFSMSEESAAASVIKSPNSHQGSTTPIQQELEDPLCIDHLKNSLTPKSIEALTNAFKNENVEKTESLSVDDIANNLLSTLTQQQQSQQQEPSEEYQRLQSRKQQEQNRIIRYKELSNKDDASAMKILLRQLLNAQTENNEIQSLRMNLERKRFELEKKIAENIANFNPVMETPIKPTTETFAEFVDLELLEREAEIENSMEFIESSL